MALDLTQLQAVTNDFWDKSTTDIYFSENPLLYALAGSPESDGIKLVTANDIVDGGVKVREFLEYGRSNVGTYGNTSTIDTSKRDIVNAARFAWSGYVASNTIDLDEQTANEGKAAMVDLSYSKLTNMQKSIRDYMGAGLYVARSSSDNSYGFDGLPDIFNTSTSTAYGSITEGEMDVWKANNTAISAAISQKVLQELFRNASVGQSKAARPNLIITTELLKDGYTRTLSAQQRFQDSKMAQAGFMNILHETTPLTYDDNQASGVVDCLNTRYLKLRAHSKYNFTAPKWEYDHKEPDVLTANVRFRGVLSCSNRKAHARGTGIAEPA